MKRLPQRIREIERSNLHCYLVASSSGRDQIVLFQFVVECGVSRAV